MYAHEIGQHTRRPERRRADRADPGLRTGLVQQRVVRQVRRQVRGHRHRADARTTAAVRDAERLVQVQVADVAAELTGLGQPEQGVQVRAVDVHLAAVVVDDPADLGDALLVHAVRGRVGDHDRGQLRRVLGRLRAQVVQVDRAVVVALDNDHLHAGHHRGGGVGAVRAGRDQADVAVLVALRPVVAADREQPGQLTLRARVRLDRHLRVPGHLGQPALQLTDQLHVPGRVLDRRERVQVGELRPGDRLHLGGRVQLHRARAERDHAAVQRVVLVGQLAQVPQHRGLGPVRVEHRVGQVVRRTATASGRPGRRQRTVVPRRRRSGRPGRRATSVFSSQEMPTWSASTSRSQMPFCRAASTTSAARPGTRASTVSKKSSCTTSTPPARSDAASLPA